MQSNKQFYRIKQNEADITNYLLKNKQSLKVYEDYKKCVWWTTFGVKIPIGLPYKI